MQYENIPLELKKLNQWVGYKLIWNDKKKKFDKIPKDCHRGYNAASNRFRTWSGFETAIKAVDKFKFDGIGFMLGNGIFGIDLDNVIDDKGILSKEARDIVDTLNSYTEISPSGKGLHVLCMGKIPVGRRRNGNVEIYSIGRFFTVTGEIFEDRKQIEKRTDEAKVIHEKYIEEKAYPAQRISPKLGKTDKVKALTNKILTDSDILSIAFKAENGSKFKSLWNGDFSGYTSQSEADMALCNMLAFYCAKDERPMDSLFRQSGLFRPKWDELRGNLTYGQITINEAIKNTNNIYKAPKTKDIKKKNLEINSEQFEYLSEEALEAYLKENGISVRYNVINRTIKIEGLPKKYGKEDDQNTLVIILNDKLKPVLKHCTKDNIQGLLSNIAKINMFNPVLEMLQAKWDGKDRLEEFYSILNISKTDMLSRKLIHCWLHQALSMAKNELDNAYGADGILVLQGKQGIGKTTLVEKLAVKQELCKLGQYMDSRDKDTYRRCSSSWIVELGEIETTFKSDLERLKSFITLPTDQYRLPYARTDQILARRTVFIGTCNTDNFLVDPTGSRRFWTIPLEKIDLDRVDKFDFLQLWLQIEEATKHNRQGFRLDPETRELLNERNTQFERKFKGQDEIEDILASDNFKWQDTTISQFKAAHDELARYTLEQIGRTLKKLGIEKKEIKVVENGKRITKRTFNLPI